MGRCYRTSRPLNSGIVFGHREQAPETHQEITFIPGINYERMFIAVIPS